jgi:hypothetical protein
MQIYIDESGNLGRKGKYFVISSVIPKKDKAKRLKRIIKKSCVRFKVGNCALPEIKSSKLTFVQKQYLVNRICEKSDFSCSYIVAEKRHLESRILNDKNICYNYLISHLLGKIIKSAKTEEIQVILDNHSIKVTSLHSLADYIKIQAFTKWGYKGKISFSYEDSRSHYVLQVVDVLANVIYGRYTYKFKHFYKVLEKLFEYRIHFPYKKFGK